MYRFLRDISLFSLPFAIVVTTLTVYIIISEEALNAIDDTISSEEKYLIGHALNLDNVLYIKWKTIVEQPRKTVLSLGTSRVLQLREPMFTSSYYGAGYVIRQMDEFRPFLESLPENKLPDVLLITLDQWFFISNYADLQSPPSADKWRKAYQWFPGSNQYRNLLDGLFELKYVGPEVFAATDSAGRNRLIGLQARFTGFGFRRDGSLDYGQLIEDLVAGKSTMADFDFQQTFAAIEKGNDRWGHNDEIFPASRAELVKLLEYATEKDIQIIALIPPFAPTAYAKFVETGNYTYYDKIMPAIAPLFTNSAHEVWQLTDPSVFDSTDDEYIDGSHAGELGYAKLMLHMSRNGSTIVDHIDTTRLKRDMENRINNFELYPY